MTTKEQTATGATGIFEMKTNTITLSGGVVITQGANVLKGDRLVVDLTTNFAKVEGGRRAAFRALFSTRREGRQAWCQKPAGPAGPTSGQKPPVKHKPSGGTGARTQPVTN